VPPRLLVRKSIGPTAGFLILFRVPVDDLFFVLRTPVLEVEYLNPVFLIEVEYRKNSGNIFGFFKVKKVIGVKALIALQTHQQEMPEYIIWPSK
jgi:hypothetical protein